MPKTASGALLARLDVQRESAPLYLEIYRSIRGAILRGELAPGARLPSTRTLAIDLEVSRTTAEEAFSQLLAEGFIERRVGDGSYVAPLATVTGISVPRSLGRAPGRSLRPPPQEDTSPASRRLSRRGQELLAVDTLPDPPLPCPFSGASVDIETFPLEVWRSLHSRALRKHGLAALRPGDPAGYRPLREAIASYTATSRGVACTPDQVIVLHSSQQALDLAARLLLDPGDAVWVEEPGFPSARAAFLAHGARLVPVPVDEEGIQVEAGIAQAPDARLACVTPSHQYPLGVTLTLARRLALLAWARSRGAWIVEDDYDSEFRYDGRPLAAIQGIDGDGRVLYLGTFAKVLYPSIRLAYLIVPSDLAAPFTAARSQLDNHTATLPQMALAEFFAEGHFGVHVRRVRELYRERRDALVRAVRRHLPEWVRIGPAEAGVHLVLHFPEGPGEMDDTAIAKRAGLQGLAIVPLSRHFAGPNPKPGLFLGFGALKPQAIEEGVRILAGVLKKGDIP